MTQTRHRITKDELFRIHQQTIHNGYDHKDKTEQIVIALGGIDNVLSLLLSANATNLTDCQLMNIHEIIECKSVSKDCQDGWCMCISRLFTKKPPKTTYYFSTTNTYLHSIFGNEMGHKLMKIAYSKYVLSFLVLMGILFMITHPNLSLVSPMISTICQLFPQITSLLWAAIVLLSINKGAFRNIGRKFEFYMKLLYVFQYVGGEWLLFFASNAEEKQYYAAPIMRTICVPLSVIMFTCLDGLQLTLNTKIAIGTLVGITFGASAIYYTCLSLELFGHPDDSIIEIKHIGITVSIFNVIANALQVTSLFIWQQLWSSIVYRKHCSFITTTPYLTWYDESNDDNGHIDDKSDDIRSKVATNVELNAPISTTTDDVVIPTVANVGDDSVIDDCEDSVGLK